MTRGSVGRGWNGSGRCLPLCPAPIDIIVAGRPNRSVALEELLELGVSREILEVVEVAGPSPTNGVHVRLQHEDQRRVSTLKVFDDVVHERVLERPARLIRPRDGDVSPVEGVGVEGDQGPKARKTQGPPCARLEDQRKGGSDVRREHGDRRSRPRSPNDRNEPAEIGVGIVHRGRRSKQPPHGGWKGSDNGGNQHGCTQRVVDPMECR